MSLLLVSLAKHPTFSHDDHSELRDDGNFNVTQKREEEAAPPAEPFKLKQFKNVPSRVLSNPSSMQVKA